MKKIISIILSLSIIISSFGFSSFALDEKNLIENISEFVDGKSDNIFEEENNCFFREDMKKMKSIFKKQLFIKKIKFNSLEILSDYGYALIYFLMNGIAKLIASRLNSKHISKMLYKALQEEYGANLPYSQKDVLNYLTEKRLFESVPVKNLTTEEKLKILKVEQDYSKIKYKFEKQSNDNDKTWLYMLVLILPYIISNKIVEFKLEKFRSIIENKLRNIKQLEKFTENIFNKKINKDDILFCFKQ